LFWYFPFLIIINDSILIFFLNKIEKGKLQRKSKWEKYQFFWLQYDIMPFVIMEEEKE